jgi:ribosomal protein L29
MKKREELNRLLELSDDDLKNELTRLKESLFRLNFKHSLGDIDTVKSLRREKKTLARVQTILRQRAES